ncbi:MAG: hypothetical protein ACREIS_02080, partial [Nitrospiraceae bacterium]
IQACDSTTFVGPDCGKHEGPQGFDGHPDMQPPAPADTIQMIVCEGPDQLSGVPNQPAAR